MHAGDMGLIPDTEKSLSTTKHHWDDPNTDELRFKEGQFPGLLEGLRELMYGKY